MPVSIFIQTLNEEDNLPGLLDSVAWADDVVVLDSLSTDGTKRIAEERGCRWFERAYDGRGPHQNWAMEHIDFKHPWVFYLDADERMTPELKDEILAIAADPDETRVAFWCGRKNFFMGKWLKRSYPPGHIMRFFKPPHIRFARLANPVPTVDGEVGYLREHFLHDNFSKGLHEWLERHNRYSTYEAKETVRALRESPVRVRDLVARDPRHAPAGAQEPLVPAPIPAAPEVPLHVWSEARRPRRPRGPHVLHAPGDLRVPHLPEGPRDADRRGGRRRHLIRRGRRLARAGASPYAHGPMTFRLYNTLTKREEDFTPLDPGGKRVTFYSCGPTVYDYAHIGNFRSFLNADVLRRALALHGYDVEQVMNMTDVGHMTDDDVADGGGEDKMEVAARRLLEAKKSGTLPPDASVDPNDPYAIADYYIAAFLEDSKTLGLTIAFDADERPELMPRPTRYVEQMVALIERLIAADHAYVGSDGVVYFDVQSYPEYGRLSGNTPDAIRSGEGGRVNEATQDLKRHPADFMLWKPDPTHKMRWASPWGEGYPGWHLECSVMAMALLGEETGGVIDVHSGGEDNIFPHHECEIAQTCCATGEEHFARYWFHTRFLIVEGEKMSKSKGNFFTVRDMMKEGASPAAVRLELIKTHYRSNANFTKQGLKDAQRMIDRWKRLEAWLDAHADAALPETGPGPLAQAVEPFKQALGSDMNVAGAIGALNEAAGAHRTDADPPAGADGAPTYRSELEALRAMDSVLGVLSIQTEASVDAGDLDVELIERRIADRLAARASKDWAQADAIRDELLELGIAIKDGAEGTTWSRVVQ